MASNISLDTASLLALVLEGVAYGFSILMFIGTIWALTRKQRMQDVSRPIIVVATLLLILSTVHIVVNTVRVEDGLVKYRNTFPGGPVAFFADLSQYTFTVKNVLYILQTLVADGVVIYRCYVVWRSLLVIVLPSMLWCSVAVTGVFETYSFSQVTTDSEQIYNERGQPAYWLTAFFASSIATNLLSSALLAYRIWIIEHGVSTVRTEKNTMMPIVRVLMDSAVLYSVALLTTLICHACSNNGGIVMIDMLMPIISITFYMVLVRIAINRKHSHTSTIEMINEPSSLQYPMQQPLQVTISKFTYHDSNAVYHDGIGNKASGSAIDIHGGIQKGSPEL
ncbi:uncharacterized protein F5147DRAFT_726486 [Suillus discolor]|uniref:Uncharacterized protein n=1 Tax=Suillus discolor TaxID=1912936 RepID=A0A9P7EUG4_9AGAM|nr:uncharacterized protein F5147DRAFT_726486 [Suillus discolor]KAG2088951.1 hypothetical protein F5147DRAFT_726486 [Suillus discolor]